MKPYGFIYITTNALNGKKYIGQCSGDPESNAVKRYFGSGKAILRAIRKNGIEHFSKNIIEYASCAEELNAAERRIIAEHNAVKSRTYYNISPGGRASLGFTGKTHTPERNKRLSSKMKADDFIHHGAKKIVLDNIEYKTKTDAISKSGYSGGQIKRFISTGIHPAKQIHGHTGKPKNYIVNDKVWFFEREDGTGFEQIKKLDDWARARKSSGARMVKSKERNVFYFGLKFSHSVLLRELPY